MVEQDFRTTFRGRRQAWFGLKPGVKRALATPIVHPALRAAHRLVPQLSVRRLPAPVGVTEVVGEADGEQFVLLDPARCEIAKELYWGKGRRPVPGDAFALDVVTRLSRQSDVLLDVGAYTGVFTLAALAANPELRAHAFEMVPAVAAGLRQNIERNNVSDRVTVHERGVGDPESRITVPSGEGGSALPSFYSARLSFSEGVEVDFISLDSLVPELPENAAVTMKIDVEGTENTVFAHGQGFLDRFRPDMLCEVLVEHASPRELEALLAPHGYSYYLVREDVLELRPRIVPDLAHRDWLFSTRAPEELAAFAPITG